MPKAIEARVRAEATKKGMSGRQADRYVYGAMNDKGFMRGNQETAKGAKAEAKYVRDHGTSHPGRNLGTFLHPKKGK